MPLKPARFAAIAFWISAAWPALADDFSHLPEGARTPCTVPEAPDAICRDTPPEPPADGKIEPGLSLSRNGQSLTVFYTPEETQAEDRGAKPAPRLTGDIQAPLERITEGLWGGRWHIRDLDQAVLDLVPLKEGTIDRKSGVTFVGPGAPYDPFPAFQKADRPVRLDTLPVPFIMTSESFRSDVLGETRDLYKVIPDHCEETPADCHFIYGMDGAAIIHTLRYALYSSVPHPDRIAFIGIANYRGPDPSKSRARDLTRTAENTRYPDVARFVIGEVIPHIEGPGYTQNVNRRTIYGGSRGAAFALSITEDHPGTFCQVIAVSPGTYERRADTSRPDCVHMILGAGTLETRAHARTKAIAAALKADGVRVTEQYEITGHAPHLRAEILRRALAAGLLDP